MAHKEDVRKTETPKEERREDATARQELGAAQYERVIKNKDCLLLMRIFDIMQEVVSLENRSQWQDDRIRAITRWMTGIHGGGGLPQGMDGTISELYELNGMYGERLQGYVRELKNAERILNGIPFEKARTFVRMYYIDGISQNQIILELNMTRYEFNHLREDIESAEDMQHVRWNKKHQNG